MAGESYFAPAGALECVAPAGETTWAAAQEGRNCGSVLFFRFLMFLWGFRCIFSLVWFVRFFKIVFGFFHEFFGF
jgi:hypothetical protein